MNDQAYAHQILASLQLPPTTLPSIKIDDSRRNNAGRCMTARACQRLSQGGEPPEHVRHTTYGWKGEYSLCGTHASATIIGLRRRDRLVNSLHELAQSQAVVYLLLHWNVDECVLHAWAVPEDVAFDALTKLHRNIRSDSKTVEVGIDDHQLKNAPGAPSFAPYYTRATLTDAEQAKLLEAIKTDDNIKREEAGSEEEYTDGAAGEVTDREVTAAATKPMSNPCRVSQTSTLVTFLLELPKHTEDGSWHERNKQLYERVLRDPSRAVVEDLRTKYIQRLNPAVAGGKRHLSILKKNDYGQGGYYSHYWFAFYDPAAGSKTKSVQLFVVFHGGEHVCAYGLGMGDYCAEYLEQRPRDCRKPSRNRRLCLPRYPAGTIAGRLSKGDSTEDLSLEDLARRIADRGDTTFEVGGPLTDIYIIRRVPTRHIARAG